MTEYRSLDQWFEDKNRADGRKFTTDVFEESRFFEPFFRDPEGIWFGLNETGKYMDEFGNMSKPHCYLWREWHPPKTKKKVTLHRPVFKNGYGSYYCEQNFDFSNYAKITDPVSIGGFFAGWIEVEVEVDE